MSLRFGANDITVPEPLAGLLAQLIDTEPGAVTAVSALPAPAHGCFQGTYQDGPSPHHGSANGSSYSASEPSPGRRAALLQLAAEVPAAVLAELLNLTPGTATRWTRDAGGDWSRYAAELARRRDHQP